MTLRGGRVAAVARMREGFNARADHDGNAGGLAIVELAFTDMDADACLPASRPDGTAINRYASSRPTASMGGDIEPLPHWAGQGVGLVTREESAAEIVAGLVTEAESVVGSLGGLRLSS